MSIWEDLPLAALGFGVFLGLIVCVEAGFWGRSWLEKRDRGNQAQRESDAFLLSAALGLLALLLGFTFSLALERYETRRLLVLDEANALTRIELEIRLLPEPARDKVGAALSAYLTQRLAWTESGEDAREQTQQAAARDLLWSAVADLKGSNLARADLPGLRTSVMESFKVSASREEARDARIPARVFTILVIFSGMASLLLGYVLQHTHQRHRVASTIITLLLTLTLVVILDIDEPTHGAIVVSHQPLERVSAAIARTAALTTP